MPKYAARNAGFSFAWGILDYILGAIYINSRPLVLGSMPPFEPFSPEN
jgi:hypothetical protein